MLQVLRLFFNLLLVFVKEVVAFGNDLTLDVLHFFLLHKLQEGFQMLNVKQSYNVIAKSAHLRVSQEPLHVFKSLMAGFVLFQERNLLQTLELRLTLCHAALARKFF